MSTIHWWVLFGWVCVAGSVFFDSLHIKGCRQAIKDGALITSVYVFLVLSAKLIISS